MQRCSNNFPQKQPHETWKRSTKGSSRLAPWPSKIPSRNSPSYTLPLPSVLACVKVPVSGIRIPTYSFHWAFLKGSTGSVLSEAAMFSAAVALFSKQIACPQCVQPQGMVLVCGVVAQLLIVWPWCRHIVCRYPRSIQERPGAGRWDREVCFLHLSHL